CQFRIRLPHVLLIRQKRRIACHHFRQIWRDTQQVHQLLLRRSQILRGRGDSRCLFLCGSLRQDRTRRSHCHRQHHQPNHCPKRRPSCHFPLPQSICPSSPAITNRDRLG